jgi:hypothetical protein
LHQIDVPQNTQFVNKPFAPAPELFQEPLKRYGPFPVVAGFEVSTVPVHAALPAEPLNVVPLTKPPDIGPVPFLVSLKEPETLPLLSIVSAHVPVAPPL